MSSQTDCVGLSMYNNWEKRLPRGAVFTNAQITTKYCKVHEETGTCGTIKGKEISI